VRKESFVSMTTSKWLTPRRRWTVWVTDRGPDSPLPIRCVMISSVDLVSKPANEMRALWLACNCMWQVRIRAELNEFKSTEMEVHEESRHYTRLH
jgi:hypothetical protein